jgi:hypothetical protein
LTTLNPIKVTCAWYIISEIEERGVLIHRSQPHLGILEDVAQASL